MKTKNIISLFAVILGLGLIAAIGTNKIFATSDTSKNKIEVNLKSIAYTGDHLTVEYTVNGSIETPYGFSEDCPVGDSVVLNNKGDKVSGGESDYIYCRPDKNGGYLVTQFTYDDYNVEKNNPKKVKIKIGDFDSLINGKMVHIAPIGDYVFDVPSQPDSESVSYPSEFAESASGLKMKIRRVDFSPSLAKVEACLTLPDIGDWGFDAYLLVGDQKFPLEYWTIPNYKKSGVLDNPERCYSVIVTNIPDYKTFRKGEVSFLIEKISRNIPDCVNATDWEKIRDEVTKYGVQPVVYDTGDYCFAGGIGELDPDANAHLNTYIREALKEEVEGPLIITVK